MVMFRGKVTGVDAKGCYVLVAALDAVSPQGPLAWTGVTPKVGDPVLLADTGDGASPDLVVVGVLNSATGGTDNAVARFDGTGGALQDSGVTIDDSGNVTAAGLAVSKPACAGLQVSSNAGTGPYVQLATGGVGRWDFFRNDTAESGSNAGSDLEINRLSDTGVLLGTALKIVRATGKVTIGAAGTTAGIEFGASGPRIMAGTGSPEGVVTAPVGSLWLRTDSATTLYVKQTGGTGNTGWVAK